VLAEKLDCLTAIHSFRDQFHIRLIPDERGNAFAEKGVVVC
jgi:hypothetical protein